MKESSYNHFIDNGDSVVCFNAFKNSYMLINKALYKEFETHKNDFEKFEFRLLYVKLLCRQL